MENAITLKLIDGIDKLTVRALRVLRIIAREIGDKTERVEYSLISEELGVEWNDVKYAVQSLVKTGILEKNDGKLHVVKKIVL